MPRPIIRKGRAHARPTRAKRPEHSELISKIDTRPMAFVALFLVVFGILWNASQIRTHALLIELPMWWAAPPDYAPPFITVQIGDDGLVTLEGEAVPLEQLAQKIQAEGSAFQVVLFRASPNSAFDIVARALNQIRSSGVSDRDICFDQGELEEHRRFERIAYLPAVTILLDEEPPQTTEMDVPLSGCEQFYAPTPARFY